MIRQLLLYRDKILVISIGIVYLWFGTLKFIPGASPAEALAKQTLDLLTFGLVPNQITYFLLAFWEFSIGICLILGFHKRVIIYLAMVHIFFTFTPLFLLPSLTFNEQVYSLTLVGQYIIKNLIIFGALLFIYPKEYEIVSRESLAGS